MLKDTSVDGFSQAASTPRLLQRCDPQMRTKAFEGVLERSRKLGVHWFDHSPILPPSSRAEELVQPLLYLRGGIALPTVFTFAGCSRYTTQLLSQPHAALLTQISTHAVHCAWSRARVRDNNFTSGGRGSLHGRHSRGEGMMVHSTYILQQPSPLPDNAHAPPNHPAVPFTGGATLDGHRVRRGTGACARLEQAPAPS